MATGTGNLPHPGMAFTPFDILTAQQMNYIVDNYQSVATGVGIGDKAIKKVAVDLNDFRAISFSNAGASSITITAPFNCHIEVDHSFGAWGFSGGSVTMAINTPSGLTVTEEISADINGGDAVARQLYARKRFTGGIANTNYTFSSVIAGNSQGNYSRKFNVRCIPFSS